MPDPLTLIEKLETEIGDVLTQMANRSAKHDEEYKNLNDRLVALWKLKEVETNAAIKREELAQKEAELRSNEKIKNREHQLKEEELHDNKERTTREGDQKDEDLKQKQEDLNNFNRVSASTIVNAAVHLVTILTIIRHEQFNNISTKALGFVGKLTK